MKRLLLATLLMCAAPGVAAETRTAVSGVAPPAARIDDLAWLEGSWSGQGLGGDAFEAYSPPADGQMVGHFLQTKAGKLQFMEIVAIAETAGTLHYRIKHFNPDLTGWEDKATVVAFPLVATDKDVWFFDGLTVRRTGPDSMTVTVLVQPKAKPAFEAPFTYRRVKR